MTLDIDSHERKIVRVETALILLTIAAIAAADAVGCLQPSSPPGSVWRERS